MQFSSVRHQQKNKRKRFLEAVWRNVDVLEKPLTDMDVSVNIRYQVTHSQNLRVRPKKKKKKNESLPDDDQSQCQAAPIKR